MREHAECDEKAIQLLHDCTIMAIDLVVKRQPPWSASDLNYSSTSDPITWGKCVQLANTESQVQNQKHSSKNCDGGKVSVLWEARVRYPWTPKVSIEKPVKIQWFRVLFHA